MSYEFMKRQEVSEVHPVDDRTRQKAEGRGLFPRRIKLGPNVTRWRRSEVMAWQADPHAWTCRAQRVA
jgi:predicted DNA-binding transcriptional regulator AlpA